MNVQMLVSTHSYDIIDSFPRENILLIDSNKEKIESLCSDSEKIDKLMQAGIIANSTMVRLYSSKYTLILEDEIIDVILGFDRILGTGIAQKYSLRKAKGVSNFTQQKELITALESILQLKIRPCFLRDTDGFPKSWQEEIKQLAVQEGIDLFFLKRHEIENYLLDPGLLKKALAHKRIVVRKKEIEKIIIEVVSNHKHEWYQAFRDRATQINNELKKLTGRAIKTDSAVQTEIDRYLEGIPQNNINEILKVYPGKELLRKVRGELQRKYNVCLSKEDIYSASDQTTSKDIYVILKEIKDRA